MSIIQAGDLVRFNGESLEVLLQPGDIFGQQDRRLRLTPPSRALKSDCLLGEKEALETVFLFLGVRPGLRRAYSEIWVLYGESAWYVWVPIPIIGIGPRYLE